MRCFNVCTLRMRSIDCFWILVLSIVLIRRIRISNRYDDIYDIVAWPITTWCVRSGAYSVVWPVDLCYCISQPVLMIVHAFQQPFVLLLCSHFNDVTLGLTLRSGSKVPYPSPWCHTDPYSAQNFYSKMASTCVYLRIIHVLPLFAEVFCSLLLANEENRFNWNGNLCALKC